MIAAAVIVAGILGAVIRYLTTHAATRWFPSRDPRTGTAPSRGLSSGEAAWAHAGRFRRLAEQGDGRAGGERNLTSPILIVNVVGSAIAGAVLGLATSGAIAPDLRLILLTGFCGGLTTFSTFSVETIQLAVDRKWRAAALNVGANFVLGIGAAAIAFAITA